MQVLAAQPRHRWNAGVQHIAEQTKAPAPLVRSALASMVTAWNNDVRKAAQQATWHTKSHHSDRYETVTSPGHTTTPQPETGPGQPRRHPPGMGR